MRKRAEVIIVAVLIIAAAAAGPQTARYVTNMKAKMASVCIVIDPGHGGQDPGKVGVTETLEKDINLQISQKLKKYLEKQGMKVILTRETDQSLAEEDASSPKVSDLKKRVEIIEKEDPVLAVSIHQNSYTDSSVRGAQVFYYGGSAEGEQLANALQERLIEMVDPSNHREARANSSYYMLKRTTVTTVIAECGFLSNSEEEEQLQDEEYQEQLAEALCCGIMDYLNENNKKSASDN